MRMHMLMYAPLDQLDVTVSVPYLVKDWAWSRARVAVSLNGSIMQIGSGTIS